MFIVHGWGSVTHSWSEAFGPERRRKRGEMLEKNKVLRMEWVSQDLRGAFGGVVHPLLCKNKIQASQPSRLGLPGHIVYKLQRPCDIKLVA